MLLTRDWQLVGQEVAGLLATHQLLRPNHLYIVYARFFANYVLYHVVADVESLKAMH
jgi:hypothetical protein